MLTIFKARRQTLKEMTHTMQLTPCSSNRQQHSKRVNNGGYYPSERKSCLFHRFFFAQVEMLTVCKDQRKLFLERGIYSLLGFFFGGGGLNLEEGWVSEQMSTCACSVSSLAREVFVLCCP